MFWSKRRHAADGGERRAPATVTALPVDDGDAVAAGLALLWGGGPVVRVDDVPVALSA